MFRPGMGRKSGDIRYLTPHWRVIEGESHDLAMRSRNLPSTPTVYGIFFTGKERLEVPSRTNMYEYAWSRRKEPQIGRATYLYPPVLPGSHPDYPWNHHRGCFLPQGLGLFWFISSRYFDTG